MPVATFQRPQPRRANTAPATTTLDPDDLTKRLSMVLAQERQRQSDRERKRQSWEADLTAARREQQRRPTRPQQAHPQPRVPAAVAVTTSSAVSMIVHQDRPTILTAADFQDQPLPSLDEDSPLETVPPRPPVPFILNSSGYVPVYAITSAIKLNNTTLRRSSSADYGRSLRRESALDLETIDENHGSSANGARSQKPTMENWRLEDHVHNPSDNSKQRKHSPAGLDRPTKKDRITACQPKQPSEEGGEGRARLRKLPTAARRPSQLGYPPEWSQVEDAPTLAIQDNKAHQSPPSLILPVRRGSERMTTPNYTWSPSSTKDGMGSGRSSQLERQRSIKKRVESYCTIHHHQPRQYSAQSPSTSSSSDSGRDSHSSYSSRSWRSSLKSSLSGSRRSSILKFWGVDTNKQQALSAGGKGDATEGSRGILILTDGKDVSSAMTPRAQKRSSVLPVFHL